MSNDISPMGTLQGAPSLDAAAPAPLARSAAAPAATARAEPRVQAVARPNVQFDPAQARQDLEEAIKRLNDHLQSKSRNLSFSFDDTINRTIITVRNTTTGEVVRQIPDETLLHVAHNLEDLKGLLFNERS